jgi:hypothetical protein
MELKNESINKSMIAAAKEGDIDTLLKLFSENKSELDVNYGNGEALLGACTAGHKIVVQYLVSKGAEITPDMSKNKEFMMRMVDFNEQKIGSQGVDQIYDKASFELKTDIDFILKCIDIGYIEAMGYIEYELSNIDKKQACDIWIKIANHNSRIFDDVDSAIVDPYKHKNFVLHMISSDNFHIDDLGKLTYKLFADEDVCRSLIEHFPDARVVNSFDRSLMCNKDFVMFAVEKCPASLKYTSYALKNDIDVVVNALESKGNNKVFIAADHIGEDLKEVIGQDDPLECLKSLQLSMKLEKELVAANEMKPRTARQKI